MEITIINPLTKTLSGALYLSSHPDVEKRVILGKIKIIHNKSFKILL